MMLHNNPGASMLFDNTAAPMLLDNAAARAAAQDLYRLPQTQRVMMLSGRSHKYMLVWVLNDGARHHLSTQEQVNHAMSDPSYL